jgi:hypothetical protein
MKAPQPEHRLDPTDVLLRDEQPQQIAATPF